MLTGDGSDGHGKFLVEGTSLGSVTSWPTEPLDEPAHLAHHPLDVRFGCPEARDARPHDRGTVAEPDLRHPRDLVLIEGRQELGGDEAGPGEAHQRKRLRGDDTTARAP